MFDGSSSDLYNLFYLYLLELLQLELVRISSGDGRLYAVPLVLVFNRIIICTRSFLSTKSANICCVCFVLSPFARCQWTFCDSL